MRAIVLALAAAAVTTSGWAQGACPAGNIPDGVPSVATMTALLVELQCAKAQGGRLEASGDPANIVAEGAAFLCQTQMTAMHDALNVDCHLGGMMRQAYRDSSDTNVKSTALAAVLEARICRLRGKCSPDASKK